MKSFKKVTLKLRAETIRSLTSPELSQIEGGRPGESFSMDPCTSSRPACP